MKRNILLLPLFMLLLVGCGNTTSTSDTSSGGSNSQSYVEVDPVEVTIDDAIPAGWTYISNNPEQYPDPDYYSAGQLKINYVGMGIQSPVLDGVYHKVTIGGVLNVNTKTDGKASTLDLVVNEQMVDDWEASGTPFSGVELEFPNGFSQFSLVMSGNVGFNVGLGTIRVS